MTTQDGVLPARTTAPIPRAGRRSRRFARLWRSMAGGFDEMLRPAKVELFSELPSRPVLPIVEIGPGTGTNFAFFPPGARVIAYEPNPYFEADLRAAAWSRGLDLDVRITDLLSEPLPDESVDEVVSTLVLCSVGDPARTLGEIERILRPGGRLRFIEHVAAPAGSARALAQRVVRRPWRALAEGCDPHNTVLEDLRSSRLEITEEHLENVGSRLDPTSPTYWGVARKTGS